MSKDKKDKKIPLLRPEVHAIKPSPFKEAMSYVRDKHQHIRPRFLDTTQGWVVKLDKLGLPIPGLKWGPNQVLSAVDKEGKPIGRPKKEFAPELGRYVIKMVRG